MSDKVIYGIDLGTTYSCLARMDPQTQQPKVIMDNISTATSLPSAVAFPPDQDGVIVGAAAKEIAFDHPECVFQFFKRYMGRDNPSSANYDPETPIYEAKGETYNPVRLSAIVLEQIKRYAAQSGENVEDVIITVPAYFSLDQRAATKSAGEIAGLNVIATINEPTAAALAFAHGTLPENRLMLVYDLGGGTFDVTLIRLTPKEGNGYKAEVLSTDGNFKLGGFDWDEVMFQLLKQKYAEANGYTEEEIEPEDLNELRGVCEQAKQKLSITEVSKVRVGSTRLEVTLDEFNTATAGLLQQTVDLMDAMLANARDKFGITESDITDVLMVGGSTRMEQVISMLNSRFGEDRVRFNDPERAVALGAAVASEMIEGGSIDPDDLTAVVEKLGLGRDTTIHFDPLGGATAHTDDGRDIQLSDEDIEQIGLGGYSAGSSVNLGEWMDQVQEQSSRGDIVDVTPSTFGLIIVRGGQHRVDNVIFKGTPTGQTCTRKYSTPGGNYTSLVLPVVQSDSQNEDDPAQRNGDDYSFPGSVDRHVEVGRLSIPVPAALPENSEVDVDISFDKLANLKIIMRIPSAGLEKELEVNFGISKEEIAAQQQAHQSLTFIDAV